MVDDYAANLVALQALIRPLGAEVVSLGSGGQAVEYVRREKPAFACALLDVQMPGMSGNETAVALRSLPETHDVPIIFLTAHTPTKEDVVGAYRQGAVDFLGVRGDACYSVDVPAWSSDEPGDTSTIEVLLDVQH